jgi:hypothetical protein
VEEEGKEDTIEMFGRSESSRQSGNRDITSVTWYTWKEAMLRFHDANALNFASSPFDSPKKTTKLFQLGFKDDKGQGTACDVTLRKRQARECPLNDSWDGFAPSKGRKGMQHQSDNGVSNLKEIKVGTWFAI